jgi:hypothetical protein
MRSTDLLGSVARLQRATAHLKERWAEAGGHWNDKASQDFEKLHLQPLPAQITLAVAAIHELVDVLSQAEQELADPDRGEEA